MYIVVQHHNLQKFVQLYVENFCDPFQENPPKRGNNQNRVFYTLG